MKNSKLDWKGVGQLVAVLVQVWTMIRVVMIEMRVGLEILGWIVADGREWFKKFLRELVTEYKKSLTQEPKTEYVIDFDSTPSIPVGLTIAPSDQITTRVRGMRNLSDIRIRLHLDVGQANGKSVKGYDLKAKLEGQEVFGAQLLDFYLKHLDLIPEDWKKKGWIFFWGTTYRDDNGYLYVRFLSWDGTRWVSDYLWLDDEWDDDRPAAVFASLQV